MLKRIIRVLDFNRFFGFESQLSESPEYVLFGMFFIPLAALILILPVGWIFRKLKFNMYVIYAFCYTLLFTFFFGAFAMLILFFITDRNVIKLAYCWLAIFFGMGFFSFLNANSLTKMFSELSKMIDSNNLRRNKS